MIKGKKALIFDLDGTLTDSIWAIRDAVNDVRAQLGKDGLDYDGVKAGINNGARQLVVVTVADEARRDDVEYIDRLTERYLEAYKKSYLHTTEPYDGMREAIEELKARGYRLAVLSNKPDAFVREIVEGMFGEGVFELLMGAHDSLVKPDPELTREAVERLGGVKTEDCVFIGDSDVDIMTARNASMTSIGVAWGYRGREFLESFGADAVIDHPGELPAVLE